MLLSFNALAMDHRVAGNQLVLSGSIAGTEIALMRNLLPANPQIDTVILRDSLGGDVWTAKRLGELFEERGFKLAVSGFCMSACVIAFMGGKERMFADGREGRNTFLALHTPTYATDGGVRFRQGDVASGLRYQILDWMGPRIKDVALLERALENKNPAGFVYLFDPARTTRADGLTVFQCQGTEKRRVADCASIAGTDALRAGFITSREILKVTP